MKLYCFWTGDNEMSKNRKKCIDSLNNTNFEVVLITPKNLQNYIKEPLHEGYPFLSEVHKSDYLRCYFMHFYGGGYSDIKFIGNSWINSYKILYQKDYLWAAGYREVGEDGVVNIPDNLELTNLLHKNWNKLIGNGCYIFKLKTPLTTEWYNNMMKLMDNILGNLKKYPSTYPRQVYSNDYKYPLRWTQLLGEIFHPLVYKYEKHILQTLKEPIFHSYI